MTEAQAHELVALLRAGRRLGSYAFGNQWSLAYDPGQDLFVERTQAEDWPEPSVRRLSAAEVVADFLRDPHSFETRRSQLS